METTIKLNHYDVFEVIDSFDIKKNRNCDILRDWTNTQGTFNGIESSIIEQARRNLEIKWDEWNEEELKMLFISIVFFYCSGRRTRKNKYFF